MTELFPHIYYLVTQEKDRQDPDIRNKPNNTSLLQRTPLVLGAALLGLGLSSLLLETTGPARPKLDNHPLCGITTGGQVSTG